VSEGAADAALAGLGLSVAQAARALAVLPAGDDLAAYRYVTSLDEALRPLADLLRAVAGIVECADAAPAVSRRLAERQAELARRRGEVEAARAALDALRVAEHDLKDTTAEADKLRGRVGELENAQRMTAEIPALRTRLRDLESSVSAASAAEAGQVVTRLRTVAGQFGQLTAKQLDAVGGQVRELIAGARAAAAELEQQQARRDVAAAELAERTGQAEQLREELERMLPSLAAWRQADADLADGLRQGGLEGGGSPLEVVRAELADFGRRIAVLDEKLRPLFADHAQAYNEARRVVNLSGRGGAREA
jgi:chromosome segregation ATPase